MVIDGLVYVKNKRNSRVEVLTDVDDLVILNNLSKKDYLFIPELIETLNISHKGLLVHLKRLLKNGFIISERDVPNYKMKIFKITSKGKVLLNIHLNSY